MKLHLIHRAVLAALLFAVSLVAAPLVGVCAFALPLLSALNFAPAGFGFGAYSNINVTTAANQVTDTADAREEAWVRSTLAAAQGLYQDCPLSDGGFTARHVEGKKPSPRILKKCIVELTDPSKIAGKTIHISTRAGLGGPGVAGEAQRQGSEQKLHVGSFDLTIGRFFFSVGYTAIARDETFQGPMYEDWIRDELRHLHAKKRNDDHLMRLRQVTASGVGLNNIIYPEGVTSEAALVTANTLDTTMISNMGQTLPRIGGVPMDISSDSGGSVQEAFTLFAPDMTLAPVFIEPAYQQAQRDAGVRGDSNRLFSGGLSMWDSNLLYRWIHRDHANPGSIGSPLLPRALLGNALTGANTGSIIHGGGLGAGATLDLSNADANNTGDTTDGIAPNYFEYFRAAPYTFYNGDTIAATTVTDRYLLIINGDGTGWGCYNYRINNGKAIIILARNTLSKTGETNTHPKGSVIVECNVLGTPISYPIMFAAQALVCGVGSINGSVSNPKMGLVKIKDENYGMDLGIGVEGVWGNAPVKRARDGAYTGFLKGVCAVPVSGAPLIEA
jgi:hypothetical protein